MQRTGRCCGAVKGQPNRSVWNKANVNLLLNGLVTSRYHLSRGSAASMTAPLPGRPSLTADSVWQWRLQKAERVLGWTVDRHWRRGVLGTWVKPKDGGRWMYKRNIEALSRNHRCRGWAINVTYSEGMFVALFSSIRSAYAVLYGIWGL